MVLLVDPSPNVQDLLVIVPVEVSVKFTVRGFRPLVGLPVKAATGTCAPIPVTELVWFGPLLARKVTTLLKEPTLIGVNLIVTLLEPNAGRAKFALD